MTFSAAARRSGHGKLAVKLLQRTRFLCKLRLLNGCGERIGFDHCGEQRRPRTVAYTDSFRLYQPYRNAAFTIEFGQVVEVLSDRLELVSMFLRHNNEAASVARHRIRQPRVRWS